MNLTEEGKEMSYGQKAVGISFNPAQDQDVAEVKTLCAELIDKMNGMRNLSLSPEQKRLYSIAITSFQESQMWGVKAITWKD